MSQNQPIQLKQNPNSLVQNGIEAHNITLGGAQTERKQFENQNFQVSQNFSIQFQLKNINRQVNKMTQKSKYLIENSAFSNPSSYFQQKIPLHSDFIKTCSLDNFDKQKVQLGKYNYYGQRYRHQVQVPKVSEEKRQEFRVKEQEQIQHRQKNRSKKPMKQKYEAPNSESYYIYFDEQRRNKQVNKEKIEKYYLKEKDMESESKLIGSQNIKEKKFIRSSFPHQSGLQQQQQARTPMYGNTFKKPQVESRWILQNKVKKLQKQLNDLKKKQSQRQKLQKFANTKQNKKDSKVFVGRQVDNLINSLWP